MDSSTVFACTPRSRSARRRPHRAPIAKPSRLPPRAACNENNPDSISPDAGSKNGLNQGL